MADLTELLSRVRNSTEDSAGNYVTDGEITDWLNEAYLDIAARLRLLQAESSKVMGDAGTSVANGTFDLPTDFVSAISLRLADDDALLVDDDQFWSYSDAGATPSTTMFRIFNEKLEMYPKPITGTTVKLRYVKKPTALSTGTDVPALPETEHKRMVRYAQSYAMRKEGKEGLSDRYLAEYEEGLPKLDSRTRLMPGPFVLTMAPGPFDQADSAHI